MSEVPENFLENNLIEAYDNRLFLGKVRVRKQQMLATYYWRSLSRRGQGKFNTIKLKVQ